MCSNSDADKRPATMSAVSATLNLLAGNTPWHQDDADLWWESNHLSLHDWTNNEPIQSLKPLSTNRHNRYIRQSLISSAWFSLLLVASIYCAPAVLT